MQCLRCGRDIPEGSSYCPSCGANLKDQSGQPILLLTSNYAPGFRVVKVLGLVYGITVRSRGIGGNLMAGLRTIKGGEIREYTEMAHQARQQALDRLSQQASAMGANAVLSVMFDSTEIGTTMDEIIAFGTAVTITPAAGAQQLVNLS